MTTASARAFNRTVTVAWPRAQADGAKALLLKVAKDGHAKIMSQQSARAGVAPDFDAYANTPSNTDIDSVVLPGPIVYRYRYVREVIKVALAILRSSGPVRSGRYAASHALYINGNRVGEGLVPFIKANDEVMIVNVVPYARKIEIGKTKAGRSFTIQESQSAVYQRAADKLRREYRNLTKIEFAFVSLSDAYQLRKDAVSRRLSRGGFRSHRKRGTAGSAITYPAIVLSAV